MSINGNSDCRDSWRTALILMGAVLAGVCIPVGLHVVEATRWTIFMLGWFLVVLGAVGAWTALYFIVEALLCKGGVDNGS